MSHGLRIVDYWSMLPPPTEEENERNKRILEKAKEIFADCKPVILPKARRPKPDRMDW